MRILILEDDPLTALDLQGLLEGCGHEVVGLCGTLADAGARIGDTFDFAFLDIDLPDGKSFSLAERLHSSHVPPERASGKPPGRALYREALPACSDPELAPSGLRAYGGLSRVLLA